MASNREVKKQRSLGYPPESSVRRVHVLKRTSSQRSLLLVLESAAGQKSFRISKHVAAELARKLMDEADGAKSTAEGADVGAPACGGSPKVLARYVVFREARAAEHDESGGAPMIVLWMEGLPSTVPAITISQCDATRLFSNLARSLAFQGNWLGQRASKALERWESEQEARKHYAGKLRDISVRASQSGPIREGLISRDALAQAHEAICKIGPPAALQSLVREVEPYLAEFVDEHASRIGRCFDAANPAQHDGDVVRHHVISFATTLITMLRQAYYSLWADSAMGTRLAELDPTLAAANSEQEHREQ